MLAAAAADTGARLVARTRAQVTVALGVANFAGALVVLFYLVYVLPTRTGRPAPALLNLEVFAAYLAMTAPLAMWWRGVQTRRIGSWLATGRDPSPEQVLDALRLPARDAAFSAALWSGAAAVFSALNAPYSLSLAGDIARTVVLGGITTCGVAYLVAERLYRPVVVLALTHNPPPRAGTLGVRQRIVVIWALSSGIPLLGIGLAFAHRSTAQRAQLGTPTVFLVVVGLVTGLVAMSFVARSVSDPLTALRRAVGAVQRGELEVQVPVDRGGEIGLLESGFNSMVGGLRERQRLADLFGRHVGFDVARHALQNGVALGGEEVDVSVLFVDIVGSTALAERRPPGEVVATLNRFFAAVVAVVHGAGGWVNKFEGDGALCVFGAPVADPAHAARALQAARELRAQLAALPGVDAAIGVSAGRAVAGNVGTEDRYEYTVIGDAVNEAARLSDLAKSDPGRVLASGAAVQRAGAQEAAHWRLGEPVTLRGRSRPTVLAGPR